MSDPSWYSILPPILAIVLAITTRQVIPSLFAGIWAGFSILNGLNPLSGVAAGLEGIIGVFADAGDARAIIFTLLIGSLIAIIEFSGGIRGFVHFLETRRWVHTGFRAQLLAWVTGIVIFIESNITLLVAGSVSRPLFDRYRVSREKLAYIIDATSAPICVMIPLNAWGAVIIGLIAASGLENPMQVFIQSIPYNFYAIFAVLLAGFVILRNFDIGPMRDAEERTRNGQIAWAYSAPLNEPPEVADNDEPPPPAMLMVAPILTMILMMPVGLYVTGDGVIREGSGSTAILWAVSTAIAVAWTMLLVRRDASFAELTHIFVKGAASLFPIATILLLALALGDVASLLGTGTYVANFVGAALPDPLLAPVVFLVSAFIAFSVGSSWGTFAVMIPIAVPIATGLGLPPPLLIGAAISGAVFGDHASPISDTTVVASLAAATDHIEHVRTQLPYALLAAALASACFFIAYFI